jgi:hypothetical protein
MFTWLAFVPWHLLLWLSLPAGAVALAWALAPEAALAAAKAVPKRVWVGAIVVAAAVIYHEATLAAVEAAAAKTADARWQGIVEAAKTKAAADAAEKQKKLDAEAGPSNADLHQQFAHLQTTLDDMRAHPSAYAVPRPAKPLPSDCVLDQGVVAAANKALRQ